MATDEGTDGRRPAAAKGSGREDRLAAALRENLRRRKAQQRARSRPADSEEDTAEASGKAAAPEPPTGESV